MKNKKLFAILTLVCFMMTLMPVAAFADVDPEVSAFAAKDGDQSVRLSNVDGIDKDDDGNEIEANTEGVKFVLDLFDKDENATTGEVYIWATNANGTVSSALKVVDGDDVSAISNGNVKSYTVNSANRKGTEVLVQFSRTGVYTVYAAKANSNVTKVGDLNKFSCKFSTITVKANTIDPDQYEASLDNGTTWVNAVKGELNDKKTGIAVTPNNVFGEAYTVAFRGIDEKALKGKTVTIETNSSSIEVNKASDVTDNQGEIDFRIAGSVEGIYEITLTVDGVFWTVYVQVGNTSAAYIETVTEPTSPLALFEDIEDEVEFSITDINGNTVVDKNDSGLEGIKGNGIDGTVDGKNYRAGSFVVLTEKPADSDIESSDLGLTPELDSDNKATGVWILTGLSNFDAEGTYTVKVILDNGAYATATWEVKKFQTPVRLIIGSSTDVIELGAGINGELKYVDANGVMKAAKDATIAGTGYALAEAKITQAPNFAVKAKSDEKYVGSTITVTAVSERYDLVATKEYKVAEGATEVAFVTKTAEVNVNNKIEWNVVDSNGTRVALSGTGTNVDTDIKYVVLDKPEGAKVSVTDRTVKNDLLNKGIGQMALTSNKIGNVAVQVVVKAEYAATGAATSDNGNTKQVKYYTGTQIFAVGNGSVGDVVVMSIGSHEVIVNDKKATIDAAPMIQNDRTFVPFRALAEAFGADVAYDEATQAVTAKLNGVEVVMTIGSATYTVNGTEKTMDVAPFINGSRTMVPVRFAAEAFGIKVIPTYNPDGTTADILFNL